MSPKTNIHPTAVVEKGAEIGAGASVGPFCCVGGDAVLGDRVELVGHVSILGATTVGAGTKIFPQAVIGGAPQNVRHKGSRTTLEIGENCVIREGVTMHVGSDSESGKTIVGSNGMFMGFSHVAHDCIVGNNVTFANGAVLAGHCEIGDGVIIGGLTAVQQFARIGHHAFLGGMSAITGDVIPYGMATGNKARLRGFNVIGMKRAGIPRSEIVEMRAAYRMIFDPAAPVSDNLEKARQAYANAPKVMEIVDFLSDRGKRPFIVPPLGSDGDDGADDTD
ncbi:MAG TPA: acyl-ACP--UDP-N-acetylglucosamine O-acyltransferase [Rhizobiaceae bacterium]|nr:acyl-ACP--UDP-N-acetylglucosamine O-acyltransferase [Rhizobiaceae bacterium]